MYKRPQLRPREFLHNVSKPTRIEPGTFLHDIITSKPTKHYEYVKQPIYNKEAYFSLLKLDCQYRGVEYVEPSIPDYIAPEHPTTNLNPVLSYIDRVYVQTRYLKNGTIRIKLNTTFPTLYEKYYSHNKLPPIKMIIQAYKTMGFTQEFLDAIKSKYDKKVAFAKKVGPAIDAIFNKEPVKRVKKKAKEEEEVAEDDEIQEEEPDDPEDDDPGEDGEMDVEIEDDLEEEPQEEMYLSDGGD